MRYIIRLSGTPSNPARTPRMKDLDWQNLGPFKSLELAETWLAERGFEKIENNGWSPENDQWGTGGDLIVKTGKWEFKISRPRATIRRVSPPERIELRKPNGIDEIRSFRP